MKLFPLVTAALAQTTLDRSKEIADSSNICGELYHPNDVREEFTLK